jgi:hypothetical protein
MTVLLVRHYVLGVADRTSSRRPSVPTLLIALSGRRGVSVALDRLESAAQELEHLVEDRHALLVRDRLAT